MSNPTQRNTEQGGSQPNVPAGAPRIEPDLRELKDRLQSFSNLDPDGTLRQKFIDAVKDCNNRDLEESLNHTTPELEQGGSPQDVPDDR